MTRKHFTQLATDLGLRLAAIADGPGTVERQQKMVGFWNAVAGVRAASRSFNPAFSSERFDDAIIKAALHELNIEHRLKKPGAVEWRRAHVSPDYA